MILKTADLGTKSGEELQVELASLVEERDAVYDANAELVEINEQLLEELQTARNQSALNAQQQTRAVEIEEECQSLRQASEKQEAERKLLQSVVDGLQSKVARTERLEHDCETANRTIHELRDANEALTQEVQVLQAEMEHAGEARLRAQTLSESLHDQRLKAEEQAAENESLRKRLKELEVRLAEAAEDIANSQLQWHAGRQEKTALDGEVQSLRTQRQALETENQGLRDQMAEATSLQDQYASIELRLAGIAQSQANHSGQPAAEIGVLTTAVQESNVKSLDTVRQIQTLGELVNSLSKDIAELRSLQPQKPPARKSSHSRGRDDLTRIDGIGPVIRDLLAKNRITTFNALSRTTPSRLQEILQEAGTKFAMHDPDSWPQQALLAQEGCWDEPA